MGLLGGLRDLGYIASITGRATSVGLDQVFGSEFLEQQKLLLPSFRRRFSFFNLLQAISFFFHKVFGPTPKKETINVPESITIGAFRWIRKAKKLQNEAAQEDPVVATIQNENTELVATNDRLLTFQVARLPQEDCPYLSVECPGLCVSVEFGPNKPHQWNFKGGLVCPLDFEVNSICVGEHWLVLLSKTGRWLSWRITSPSNGELECTIPIMMWERNPPGISEYEICTVLTLAELHDRNLVFGGTAGGSIFGWRLDDQKERDFVEIFSQQSCAHPGAIQLLYFKRDVLLSSSAEGTVALWDSFCNPLTRLTRFHSVVTSAHLSFDWYSDKTRLSLGFADGTIAMGIQSLTTPDQGCLPGSSRSSFLAQDERNPVQNIAMLDGGDCLITGGSDSNCLKTWMIENNEWKVQNSMECNGKIIPGTLVVTDSHIRVNTTDGSREIWMCDKLGQACEDLATEPFPISAITIIESDGLILAGMANGLIHAWAQGQIMGQKPLQVFTGHASRIVDFAEQFGTVLKEPRFFSLDTESNLRLWDLRTGTCLRDLTSIVQKSSFFMSKGCPVRLTVNSTSTIIHYNRGIVILQDTSPSSDLQEIRELSFASLPNSNIDEHEINTVNCHERGLKLSDSFGDVAALAMIQQIYLFNILTQQRLAIIPATTKQNIVGLSIGAKILTFVDSSENVSIWDISNLNAPSELIVCRSKLDQSKITALKVWGDRVIAVKSPKAVFEFSPSCGARVLRSFNPAAQCKDSTFAIGNLKPLVAAIAPPQFPSRITLLHYREQSQTDLSSWLLFEDSFHSECSLTTEQLKCAHFPWHISDLVVPLPTELIKHNLKLLLQECTAHSICARNFYTFLFEYAIWSRSPEAIRFVGNAFVEALAEGVPMVEAIEQDSQTSKSCIRLGPDQLFENEPLLAAALTKLVSKYPHVALEIFQKIPLLEAPAEVDAGFQKLADFTSSADNTFVISAPKCRSPGIWKSFNPETAWSKAKATPSKSFVHPIPHVHQSRQAILSKIAPVWVGGGTKQFRDGILEGLVQTGRSDAFQSAQIRALVNFRWADKGCLSSFFEAIANHLLGLVAATVLVLSMDFNSGPWVERNTGSADIVVAGVVAFIIYSDLLFVETFLAAFLRNMYDSSKWKLSFDKLLEDDTSLHEDKTAKTAVERWVETRQQERSAVRTKIERRLQRGSTVVRVTPFQASSHVNENVAIQTSKPLSKRARLWQWVSFTNLRFREIVDGMIATFVPSLVNGWSLFRKLSEEFFFAFMVMLLVFAVLVFGFSLLLVFVLIYSFAMVFIKRRISNQTRMQIHFLLALGCWIAAVRFVVMTFSGQNGLVDKIDLSVVSAASLCTLSLRELVSYKLPVDIWGILRILAAVAAIVAVVILSWIDGNSARGPLSAAVFLQWMGTLFYMQGFRSTAAYVRAILEVLYDIRFFVPVMGVVLFAVGISFYTLLHSSEASAAENFLDVRGTSISIFSMMLLGNMDPESIIPDTVSPFWVTCLFVTSALAVPIVLLNLLIAILSDSFERVQDSAENEFYALRARLAVRSAKFFSQSAALHILVPEGSSIRDANSGYGMLHDIKHETRQGTTALHGLIKDLVMKIGQLESRLELPSLARDSIKREDLKCDLKADHVKKNDSPELEWLRRSEPEPIVLPDISIVDAHHHLWDISNDTGMGELLTPVTEELERNIMDGHRVLGVIFADGGSFYDKDASHHLSSVGETRTVAKVAEDSSLVVGILANVDLTLNAELLTSALNSHNIAGKGLLRGVRSVLAFDKDEWFFRGVVLTETNNIRWIDENHMMTAEFIEGAKALAALGLVLDVAVYHSQLLHVSELARLVPNLTIVVDHVGGPLGLWSYAAAPREDGVLKSWKEDIRELAKCSNVRIKLGGLLSPGFGTVFHRFDVPVSSQDLAECWGPWFNHCINCFGSKRCMFESNFPTKTATCSYRTLFNAFKKVAIQRNSSAEELEDLFSRTAIQTYNLNTLNNQ